MKKQQASLALRAPEGALEFGAPFELTVERSWPADVEVARFDEGALAPLVLVLEERALAAEGGRARETLRYRAHAFALGELELPALELRSFDLDGQGELLARSQALRLTLASSLQTGDAGLPEPPPGPLPIPGEGSALDLLVGAALLVAAALLALWRERAAGGPAPSPEERARRALERVGGDVPAAREALREYVEARFGLPASRRTSEELSGLAVSLPRERRDALRALLARFDRARFGGRTPAPDEAALLVEDARRFVAESAPEAAA